MQSAIIRRLTPSSLPLPRLYCLWNLRLARTFLSCWLVLSCSGWAFGQVTRSEAQRMGLEAAWQTQIQVPASGRGIVSAHLWADATQMRQFAVVELPDRTIRISADQVDRRGNPIGLAQAKQLASAKAQRLMPGKPLDVVEVSIPQLDLVLVTSDGMVQNFDAETGSLLWATACGSASAPAHPATVSPAGVTVVHGTDLYLLDWKTGIKLMRKPLIHGTSNAVIACNDIAFVSDFRGQVEAYGLGRPLLPWSYRLSGHAVGRPVTTADNAFTAIATDKGFAYVFAGGNAPKLWLRYEARARILGSLATGNNAFYVASDAGVLAKITLESRLGEIAWEFASGKAIVKPPLVINDTVYVATEAGDLIAIDDADGNLKWFLPLARIDTPISVLDGHVVSVSTSRQLISTDIQTGKITAITGSMPLGSPIINTLTDRVYLITANGALQCLRPIGHELPILHRAATLDTTKDKSPGESTPKPSEKSSESPFGTFGTGGADPFGEDGFGSDDPFGGGAGGNAGAGDPFGGDPFGGDPFGGDPF
jgi:outer membrane protein assembly factor BamB